MPPLHGTSRFIPNPTPCGRSRGSSSGKSGADLPAWADRPAVATRVFFRTCGGGRRRGPEGQRRPQPKPICWHPNRAHFPTRAKHVVFLFMNGAPARSTRSTPSRLSRSTTGHLTRVRPPVGSNGRPVGHLMKSPFPFARHGQSGLEISSLFPHTARFADDLCVIRSMYTDTAAHASGCLQMNTGNVVIGKPSLGVLAELRAGDRDREPAQLRRDDRPSRRPDLGRIELGGRVHAGRVSGDAVPRQGFAAARPGHAGRARVRAPNGIPST